MELLKEISEKMQTDIPALHILLKSPLSFSDTYSLDNPREVGIMPTMTGSIQMALTSVCAPFKVKRLKDHIDIPKTQVMFNLNADEIDSELINGYKSEISGIKLATPSDMAAINTKSSNTNEFII